MNFNSSDVSSFFNLKSKIECKIADVARCYHITLDPRNENDSSYLSDYWLSTDDKIYIEYKIRQYDYDDEQDFHILIAWLSMDVDEYTKAIKDYIWEMQREERESKEKAATEFAEKQARDAKIKSQKIIDEFWGNFE
jgi:hypothetical protein